MARKKIREYDSKRLLKEHFKRISGRDLPIKSAQVRLFFFSVDCDLPILSMLGGNPLSNCCIHR